MPQIRFVSGPRKGQTEHAPHSPELKLLLGAGLVEIVQPVVPPATVTWSVCYSAIHNHTFIQGLCSRGCKSFYDGPAKGAKFSLFHACGGPLPESCPEHILEEYAQRFTNREIDPTEAEMHHIANRKQYPNEQILHFKD